MPFRISTRSSFFQIYTRPMHTILLVGQLGCGEKETTEEEPIFHGNGYSFRSAEECAECHAEIVEEWKLSPHATTALNPIYTKMSEKFMRDRGVEFTSTTCTGCHMPGGVIMGEPALLPYEQRSTLAKEGVTCDVCHTADTYPEEIMGEFDSIRLTFAKSDVVFTSHEAPSTQEAREYHEVRQNPLIRAPEMCIGCHDQHYSYYDSPADQFDITCTDCHMTTTPGVPFSGVLSHQVVGLGYSYEYAIKDAPNREELMAKQEEWASRAMKIEDVIRVDNENSTIVLVEIENLFNAHWLPSVGAVNNIRQMWIEISVWDASDTLIFSSGYLDAQSDLCDEFSREVQLGRIEIDEQLWTFQTIDMTHVLGEQYPVCLSIDSAGVHLDNSLYPNEKLEIQYSLPFLDTQENIFVEVNILQRHYTPYMLRDLGLDNMVDQIHTLTMESWTGAL